MLRETPKTCLKKLRHKAFCIFLFLIFCAGTPIAASAAEDIDGTDGSFITKKSVSQNGDTAAGGGFGSQIKTAWKKTLRVFTDYLKFSRPAAKMSPVIDNGVIYTGSTGKKFYAINVSDGKKLWTVKTDSIVEAGATVSNGIVYFGSKKGTLYAVDKSDGTVKWTAKTRLEIQSPPVINGEAVYTTSIDGRMYAFNISAGEKLWGYFDTDSDLVFIRFRSSFAFDGERLFMMSPSGHLIALSADSGKELWRFKLLLTPYPDANVNRNVVFDSGLLYALDNEGYLVAIDPRSGGKKLRYDIRDVVDFSISDDVMALATKDKVHVLKRSTGELLWSDAIEAATARHIALVDGRLFLAANMTKRFLGSEHIEFNASRLILYSAVTGERLWEKEFFKHTLSGPALDSGRIALVNENALLRVLAGK